MDQDSSILCATQALNMYSSQIQTIVMQSVEPTLLTREFYGHILVLEHDLGGFSSLQTHHNCHIEYLSCKYFSQSHFILSDALVSHIYGHLGSYLAGFYLHLAQTYFSHFKKCSHAGIFSTNTVLQPDFQWMNIVCGFKVSSFI